MIMKFHEEMLTILSVKQIQDDLILRLDISDWFKIEDYKDSVLELKIINCENPQKSFEEIIKYIGELVWHYGFVSEEKLLNVLIDDGSNIEIVCAEISEEKSDLTIDELFSKFQHLQENYHQESESGSKGWGKYQKLKKLLETEIKSEIQNLEKKKSFFEHKESVNTDKTEIAIKLCKRVLNYIEQVERES